MNHFLKKVKNYIVENDLLDEKEKIIVGVSGGADSMALLNILISLDYTCIAAHCNFNLRGEESYRDEDFVKDYCRKYGVECITTSFDTYTYMKEKSVSLEMAARELRYSWFGKISVEYDAQYIAVAHNQDDSVETILINLIRGTGIKGLTGINPKNGKVIRPVLCLSRNEILEYLASRSISYVEDSTNKEDIYLRNKIRLNIIPQLEEINPSVKQTLSNNASYLRDVESIYYQCISTIAKKIFDGKQIDIDALLNTEKPNTILFEILRHYGFNSPVINEIVVSLKDIPGKVFYSENYRLVKDRKFLLLDEIDNTSEPSFYIYENNGKIDRPINLSVQTYAINKDFILVKDKNILYADNSKVTFPLHIRKWKQGDRFMPFGMKGSQKVSDYFTDHKFSIIEKERTWLLCTAKDEIIWIIGHRTDGRFCVTTRTDTVLKIEFLTG